MIKELPIHTLDSRELLAQFKIMKALGYRSLWDADFRRDMRNPLRRHMYYRLIVMEEAQEHLFQIELFKRLSNRVGFFSNPEFCKKILDEEEQREWDSLPEDMKNKMENKHLSKIEKHPKMSPKAVSRIQEVLKKS